MAKYNQDKIRKSDANMSKWSLIHGLISPTNQLTVLFFFLKPVARRGNKKQKRQSGMVQWATPGIAQLADFSQPKRPSAPTPDPFLRQV